MKVNDILLELAATPSRLDKEAILRREKDNADLMEAVILALNSRYNYFIKKIPLYSTLKKSEKTLSDAFNLCYDLSDRKYTGNLAIAKLADMLDRLPVDDAQVLEKIIQRDLRCGVQASTVNKIWAGLIPEYPCMLASGYDEKLIRRMNWPAIAQCKFDGMRFNAVVEGDSCILYSRNGKIIDLRNELEPFFIEMAAGQDVVYDGELLVVDPKDGTVYDRKTGNGILNKAVKGTISPNEAKMVCARLWDRIPLGDFNIARCLIPYQKRLRTLYSDIADTDRITIAETYPVANIDEAKALFEKFLADGQEGIILKDATSPWEDKRATHQIKFKGELECDLVCVGWEEGTGKNVGRLGALVLSSSDGLVTTNCGSGFSDSDREAIGPSVVGSIVTVKYNARIKDKTRATDSLFLPIFLEIREDKSTADSSAQIK